MMICVVQQTVSRIKFKFSFPKPELGEIPLYVGCAIYVATMAYLVSTMS